MQSAHLFNRVASQTEREPREPLVTGNHYDSTGLCGKRTGTLSQVPRAGGWGAGPRAARCALMIVFAEEFWTPHYTIFILFAK